MLELRDTPVEPRRRKRRREWWIVGGVLFALGGVLVFSAWDGINAPVPHAGVAAKPQAEIKPVDQVEAPIDDRLIDDDGKALWASPTSGRPIDLTYLPPESEIVLALRPSALIKHIEGQKVLAAIGPIGTQAIERLTRTTGLLFSEIEQMVVGWRFVPNHGWAYSLLVHVRRDLDRSKLRTRLEKHVPNSYLDRTFVFDGDRVYFRWDESDRLVEGTLEMFADFFPPEPLVPIGVKRLLRDTDAQRQVTLIVRPQFLLGDKHDLLRGTMEPLRQPLFALIGHDIAAAALSLNWDENFFMELVAVPTLDSSPEKMSRQLASRVDTLPTRVEEFVLRLQTSPYGRRVISRLPEMTRRLAAYTRHGFDRDAAVLRCYLPATAGHNLIMAGELALAEGQGSGANRTILSPVAEATSPGNIVERLQAKTSLRFDREELEAALDMLAQDLGVEIVIRGPDLQADGITRNQLFAIDMTNRSGEEILVEILRRANPDKLASGPADPRQKLVYVVGPDAITITTRSRAAERGELLPSVFREAR